MRTNIRGRLALLALAMSALAACAKSAADIDRTVKRPTHEVYRAFSKTLPPSGTNTVRNAVGPAGDSGPVTATVKRELDKSIEMSIEAASARMFAVRFQFDQIRNGAATRVRATVDFNPILFAARRPGFERLARGKVKDALDFAVDEVAAGRPPLPLGKLPIAEAMGRGDYPSYGDARPAQSRVGPSTMNGGRVIPMQSAEPMVDPNAVARRNRYPRDY